MFMNVSEQCIGNLPGSYLSAATMYIKSPDYLSLSVKISHDLDSTGISQVVSDCLGV